MCANLDLCLLQSLLSFLLSYVVYKLIAVLHRYLGIYVAIACAGFALQSISEIWYLFGTIRASRVIHAKLISSVFRATIRYADDRLYFLTNWCLNSLLQVVGYSASSTYHIAMHNRYSIDR